MGLRRETIEYNGRAYHRYPDAKEPSRRIYYRCGSEWLHRQIYIDNHGPIPEGYIVHHIDGNPENNDPSNLECVSPKEHSQRHPFDEQRRELARERMQGDSFQQNLCRQWHASEEGHRWHSEHGKEVAQNMEERQYFCLQCGKEFWKKPFGQNKFCSNACKSAYRRGLGVDNVDRQCIICGKTFTTSKYSKTRTCSRQCRGRLHSRNLLSKNGKDCER